MTTTVFASVVRVFFVIAPMRDHEDLYIEASVCALVWV